LRPNGFACLIRNNRALRAAVFNSALFKRSGEREYDPPTTTDLQPNRATRNILPGHLGVKVEKAAVAQPVPQWKGHPALGAACRVAIYQSRTAASVAHRRYGRERGHLTMAPLPVAILFVLKCQPRPTYL
jgi:hypothetical protein